MLLPQFLRHSDSLPALYEHNYQLFRLVVPQVPVKDGWFVLESLSAPPVYVHRTAVHPYTSEWLIGHYYPQKTSRAFSPDYTVRVYHDARLCEAMLNAQLPVRQIRQRKLELNRALGEWLDYCRRRQFVLNAGADVSHLPRAEALL